MVKNVLAIQIPKIENVDKSLPNVFIVLLASSPYGSTYLS